MTLPEELKARGLIEHSSSEPEKILAGKRTVYIGVDPTADSLHVGHLAWVLLMKRLGAQGHKLVFLVGGGTGMIGDPKEKGERVLLDQKTVAKNAAALKAQLKRILGSTSFRMVDNADWLMKEGLIPFLRDVGKHFTVNDLVKRENIKRRLDTPDESISYTEFTYALLQGFDYLTLNRKYGVDLQIGASDQWTNILSGVDLIRKADGKTAYALTIPLVTDSQGRKFGKSEGNAVWLDADKTSPFAFYQFWLNVSDDVVEKYLKVYTLMSLFEIDAIVELHSRGPGRREAQRMLAEAVTRAVHGDVALKNVMAVTDVLYGGRTVEFLTKPERMVLLSEAPSATIKTAELALGYPIVDALVATGLASSKSEAKRLIEAKGVSLAGVAMEAPDGMLAEAHFKSGLALIRRGKQVAVLSIEK